MPQASAPSRNASFAAVGRHRLDQLVAANQVQLVEPLAQLARLRVPHPHAVADPQARGGRAAQRGLDLAGTLLAVELQALRQVRGRKTSAAAAPEAG